MAQNEVADIAEITEIREMTDKEKESMGWEDWPHRVQCLVLKNGGLIVPSQDEECNGPGEFLILDPDGKSYYLTPSK